MRNITMGCVIAALATAPMLVAGCNASAGVGASLADMQSLYKVGRKWEYLMTGGAGGQSSSQVQTWEVTKVEGNKATLKISVGGASSESTIDLASQNPYASMGAQGQGQAGGQLPAGTDVKVESSVAEKLTVKAGSYDTTKVVSTVKMPQADVTSTTWVSKTVGLVKSDSTVKLNMGGIQMPAGMPLPAAMAETKTSLELQSFTQ